MFNSDLRESEVKEATTSYGISSYPIDFVYNGGLIQHQEVRPIKNLYFRIVDQKGQAAIIGDWPEKIDPYTQTDLISIEEEQIQELIYQVRKTIDISINENIANRLITLFYDVKEEGPTSSCITVSSLRNFYFFLLLISPIELKYPAISLTPDNDIFISWENRQGQVFSVHFLENWDVHFVIFKKNDRHPERTDRFSGITTTDQIIETIDLNGIWDLICI
ncbi:MAG: hypothetical protein JXI43_10955 [Tissierellales bacterium]|nr:hypothetical protein [Tissierellales bacterium]